MKKFLVYTIAAFVGALIAYIVLSIIIFGSIVGAITMAAAMGGGDIENNSVLVVDLSTPVTEIAMDDPFRQLTNPNARTPLSLKSYREALREASSDDRIEGIIVKGNSTAAGMAVATEMRKELEDFKKSGKFVYSYGEYFSENAYYVASVADSIFLNPVGIVEWNGLVAQPMYYKGMFDKIGVKPKVFRVGTFKSAVEPFIQEEMSEPARLQLSQLLENFQNVMVQDVARSRNISAGQLRDAAQQMLVREASDALTYGLVDDTVYYDQYLSMIRTKLGLEKDDKVKSMSLKSYYNKKHPKDPFNQNEEKEGEVAVVFVEGNIMSGSSSDGVIGSDDVAKQLRKLRLDDEVKSVVLRVNSPGGSALASDVIWREVKLLSEEKKIVASMGNLAASGGYYISMAANHIYAHPNTITGSIGIFAILFNATEMLNDKLGLTVSEVSTGEFSNIGSPFDDFTEAEEQIIQNQINRGYQNFVSKAARGRGMGFNELEQYASGRVWSGSKAVEIGLVDELGGLDQAIAKAAELADLGDGYSVQYLGAEKDALAEFFKQSQTYVKQFFIQEQFKMYAPLIQKLEHLQQMEGMQARMPYELEIK